MTSMGMRILCLMDGLGFDLLKLKWHWIGSKLLRVSAIDVLKNQTS